MRILQFSISDTKAGVTQYIYNIWNNIDSAKIQFDFLTFSKKLSYEDEITERGSKVHYIHYYPEQNIEAFVKEFNAILDEGYDAIELHTMFWRDTIIEKMVNERNMKSIIHAHSSSVAAVSKDADVQAILRRHIEVRNSLTDRIATQFWGCSKESLDWLYGSGISEEKKKIIPNAIDIDRFKYKPEIRKQIRKELGIENRFVLGHAGRLEREKNQLFLLDVFSKVYESAPDSVLMLLGRGGMQPEIEKRASELGIRDAVYLMGFQDKPEDYMQAMDMFVFPSTTEGFPLSLIEAQCSGLTVLYSDCITSTVKVTDLAMDFPLNMPSAWYEKIMECRKYCQESRRSHEFELMERGYDIHGQIKAIQEAYLNL